MSDDPALVNGLAMPPDFPIFRLGHLKESPRVRA
jgi:hypothetical protein